MREGWGQLKERKSERGLGADKREKEGGGGVRSTI